ncbi:MAG: class I SAM-dependent methyltransferase [Planctomycetota bacterium]
MRIRTEADFDALARGAMLLAVTAAWSELGVWDELVKRKGPVDLAELPGDTRALTITAPMLAHVGLLDGSGRQWMINKRARDMHERGELPVKRTSDWLADLARMREVLADGGPVLGADGKPKVTSGGVRPHDVQATREFLDMLYRRSGPAVGVVADWLVRRLPAGGHVIDVGGGHGRYAEALVDRGCTVTLFDMPMVIDLARERYGDKLRYHPGNFHEDSFGGPYDAAFLSNIVHGESSEANADLLQRLSASLRPGGWILLKDVFIDEQGRDPEHAVFFGGNMLYYTAQGRSYTLHDVARWCDGAGLEPPEALGVDTYCLVFARKPL